MNEESKAKEDTKKAHRTEEEGAAGELTKKLEECAKEKEEYLRGWQRAKADFINYKRDEVSRLEDIARFGSEELIKELITVLDNFDLGLRALEKAGPVEKGVYMIRTHIEDILKKRGLERIPISPGDEYDPAVAEAIVEVESERPQGTVIEEIEPGYRLYGKILRPARVKVAKSKQE